MNSPPTDNPWRNRQSVRAIAPMVSYVGRSPTRQVGMAMSRIDQANGIAPSQRLAPIAEQHGSKGPCEKPDGKDSEGGNQRQRRIRGGKEEDSKHGREVAIEGEVIPFEHVADRAGEERFLHH